MKHIKIKISKKYFFEDTTLLLITLQVLLFRFLNIQSYFNKVIVFFVAVSVLKSVHKKRFRPYPYGVLIFCVISSLLVTLNGLILGFHEPYINNILMLFYPLIDALYLLHYCRLYPQKLINILLKTHKFINCYFILNIIVLFIQMSGIPFLVGIHDWENPAYYDLISGLFGYSTTHVLCMFSVFFVIYELAYIRLKDGKNKLKKYIYVIIITLLTFYISFVNDNTAYYLVLILFLAWYILFSNKQNTLSKARRNLFILLIILAFVISTILLQPKFVNEITNWVNYKIVGSFSNMEISPSNITNGSMERIAQIYYGINYADGLKLGVGLSRSGLFNNVTFGFKHFGLASAGAVICLGGIWLYFSLICLYAEIASSIIEVYSGRKKMISRRMCYIITWLILSIYTTIFTDVSVTVSTFFIVLAFCLLEI